MHAYNTIHYAVMGYSLHYLMFWWRPRLLVNFYFSTVGSTKAPMKEASTKCVDKYIASIWDSLRTTLWGCKPNQQQKCVDKNGTMTEKSGLWTWSLATWYKWRQMLLRERGRSRKGGKRIHGRWCIRLQQMSPLMKWWTNMEGHASSTETNFFLSCQRLAFPCV